MATSVNLGYCLWQDGSTVNGQIGRNLDVASQWATQGTATSLTILGGVIGSVGSMQVNPVSGMTIQICAGFCVVPNSTSNLQGAYRMGSMVSNNLTVTTSDPINPRIDLVCATVFDPGTSSGFSQIQVIAGTPASIPAAPALPANSVALALIAVAANAVSVVSANITDKRQFTSVAGGAAVYSNLAASAPGFSGLMSYDASNDRFFHNNAGAGSGARMKTLPWPPVMATNANSVLLTTSSSIIKTLNFTTDGQTDIKITFSFPGIFQQTTMGLRLISFSFFIDSTAIQAFLVPTRTDSALAGIAYGGQTLIYCTSSNTSDTPSAGTHTCTLRSFYQSGVGSGDAPQIWGTNSGNIFFLRVEPVGA